MRFLTLHYSTIKNGTVLKDSCPKYPNIKIGSFACEKCDFCLGHNKDLRQLSCDLLQIKPQITIKMIDEINIVTTKKTEKKLNKKIVLLIKITIILGALALGILAAYLDHIKMVY